MFQGEDNPYGDEVVSSSSNKHDVASCSVVECRCRSAGKSAGFFQLRAKLLGTYFADVTGDGKADAIVVNSERVTVRRSDGSQSLPNESFTQEPYYGDKYPTCLM